MTDIAKLLQKCTLRVSVPGGHGTGFFVAPQLILTCAHVVESANSETINVFWQYQNQQYSASLEKILPEDHLDLAILKLNTPDLNHPCINFESLYPQLNDDLFSYGYPQDYPDGDSATFKYEGESFKGNSPLYKLKGGQANYGASGSPLLNQRTGKVCGILNISRNPNMDLGGRAVPITIIFAQFPELAELNQRFHQKNAKKTGVNPFDYGTSVSPERFYGRKQAILEVKSRIGAIASQSINIVGMRRNGKTSLLGLIRERTEMFCQPQQKPLIVTLDLQSPKFYTPEGIIEGLRREILKQTGEDWLEQALPRLGERRLLLNLDEFEKIGIAIKEKRLSLNLFDELRHLIQHYDSLAFLFSGVQTLDELGPNWSSYFISVVPLEMTYLEPDEAESLLTNPDPEFALHYDRGIVDNIIQLTRCQPYLLQLLGSALVTQANLNHTQLVTPDLLQAAIPEAFTNGEPYFTNVWTEFTGNNPAEIIAGQEFLLELANGLAPGNSQDLTDAAIGRLRRYHAIEQTDNGYVFEVPLLERWVRERAVKNSNY